MLLLSGYNNSKGCQELDMNSMSLVVLCGMSLSVLTLWLPRFYFVTVLLAVVALGYAAGAVTQLGLLWLALLGGVTAFYVFGRGIRRTVNALSVALLALALGLHLLPGFHSLMLIHPQVLSPGAVPFFMKLSFDKAMAGIIMAAFIWKYPIDNARTLVKVWRIAAPIIVVNVAVLITLSMAMGYLNFAPKYTSLFWIWTLHNLLITCLGEEVFFRGFIQRELTMRLSDLEHGAWFALFIAAVVFGSAHFAGGWQYALLAAVAGAGYGLVFMKTQRLEMAMLAHFAMNATHFLLFAYPRLA